MDYTNTKFGALDGFILGACAMVPMMLHKGLDSLPPLYSFGLPIIGAAIWATGGYVIDRSHGIADCTGDPKYPFKHQI